MSLRRQAARGVLWSTVQHWGSSLVTVGVFAALARLLEPTAFGLVAVAMVLIGLLQVFLAAGLSQALVQRESLEPEHLDTAFWLNVTAGVGLGLACMLAAEPIAALYGLPDLAPIIRWLSVSIPIGALSVTQQAILHRALAFKSLAVRTLLATLAGGAVGIGMALAGKGVWSLVAQQICSSFVGMVVLWRASDWRPGWRLSRRHGRELLSFGLSVLGSQFFGFVGQRSPVLLIGYFLGPVLLGYYTIANTLIQQIIQVFSTSLSPVLLPTLSRLQNSVPQMRSAFLTAVQMGSFIGFPMFFGIAATAQDILVVVCGPKWVGSTPILELLVLAGVAAVINLSLSPLIYAAGKPSWVLQITALNAIITILGVWLSAPWGIVAVSAVVGLRQHLLTPIRLWFVRQVLDVSWLDFCRTFSAALLASAVMYFLVIGVRARFLESVAPSTSLAVSVAIGVLAYGGSICLLDRSLLRKAVELVQLAASGGGLSTS